MILHELVHAFPIFAQYHELIPVVLDLGIPVALNFHSTCNSVPLTCCTHFTVYINTLVESGPNEADYGNEQKITAYCIFEVKNAAVQYFLHYCLSDIENKSIQWKCVLCTLTTPEESGTLMIEETVYNTILPSYGTEWQVLKKVNNFLQK